MTSQRLWLFLAATLALGTRAGLPVAEDVEKGHAPVTWEQVLALPNHGAAPARHAYGSAPQQTLLALPAQNTSRGVLLLVHGGCWSNAFDREHTLPMAEPWPMKALMSGFPSTDGWATRGPDGPTP